MKNNIKSSRKNKREVVIPFDGEEQYVVPKQGGFGQPDDDKFISVDNQYANLTKTLSTNSPSNEPTTQTGEGLPSSTTTTMENPNYNTSSGGIHGATTSTPSTSSSGSGLDTTTITPELTPPVSNTPTPSGTLSNETITNPPLTDETLGSGTSGSGTSGSGTNTPPKTTGAIATESTTPLNFPDYSTLDCTSLQNEISKLQLFINTNTIGDLETANAYNDALASAKSFYTTKCNVTPPSPSPSPVVIAPIPSTGGGGFGGGGGGGSVGEQPQDAQVQVEEPKSNKGWLLILLIIGGIYLLSRKSNKS